MGAWETVKFLKGMDAAAGVDCLLNDLTEENVVNKSEDASGGNSHNARSRLTESVLRFNLPGSDKRYYVN